jgi:hypothetical protein
MQGHNMGASSIALLNQGSMPPSISGGTLPPAISQDPRVQAAQQQASAANSQVDDIQARKQEEMAPINADIAQKAQDLGQMAAKGPDQQALPENTAKHIDSKQLSDSFSAFMTLGALAGLLSKTPMTAALNNMTGAIKGVQEGDEEQYKRQYDQFTQNYQKAIDANKAKLDEYNRIFANSKISLDEKVREAGLVANKYGDELVRAEARNQNAKGIQQAIDAASKAQEHASDKKQELDHWHQEHVDKMTEHADSIARQNAELDETIRYHNAEIEKMKATGVGRDMPATMRKSVELDIKELNQSLDKLTGLKTKTGSPFLSEEKPGVFAQMVGKGVTPAEMQTYDVYANRIATGIASIQSMGRGQVSDSKVREARKLVPQLGDKPETVAAKIAQIKAIKNMAQEEMDKGGNPSSPIPGASETKNIGGVNYHKVGGQWMQE